MKHHLFRSLCVFLLLFCVYSSFFGDISSSEFSSLSPYTGDSDVLAGTTGRSLLSLTTKSSSTALIAALDGNIHLVENNSMRVIWSFDSGSPIYTSYQAPVSHNVAKENTSESSNRFFIDCGDDWELYMHSEHFGEVKLSMSIEDFVKSTPYVSEDGAVTLGSRKATVFEIEPLSGKLIRSYKSTDSASTFVSDDEKSVLNMNELNDDGNNKDLQKTGLVNPVDPRLHITRTDYSLHSFFPGTEVVSWSMTVAEIGATLLCPDIDNPSSGASLSAGNNLGSEVDFDFSMPLPCQSKGVIFRQRNHVILESSRFETRPDSHNMNNMFPISGENLMLPSEPIMDKPMDVEHQKLPAPNLNIVIPSQTNESGNQSNDREAVLPLQPLLDFNKSRTVQSHENRFYYVDLLSRLLERHMQSAVYAIIFSIILVILVLNCKTMVAEKLFSNQNPSLLYSKIASSKKKKLRKRGKNNCNVDQMDLLVSTENGDGIKHNEGNLKWLSLSSYTDGGVNGRRIGKLFVSTREIAKGSNGTVVLEGIYEGRTVAVKRLVQAHHDVAFKEIQNLIASDQHPNIVRWYGVEYDQDFVYLSLERCTCSLDDLLRAHSNFSQNLDSVKNYMADLPLWKASGHPSSLLIKLMRDVVSGLGHLHNLGIVHRDLKPQNVLIVKNRTLCGKLSDMGISKRLVGDMSSLGHQVTGCGSSGWQAPEQLLHGRQTRAVDLFSLGCVLFFCISGGRHPFGDRFERDSNIVKNQMDLFLVEFIPEAVDLISSLLNPIPELRPKAWEVLQHPLFWNSETRLSFLRDTSDRVELENREKESDILKALESVAPVALGAKWDEKIEPIFITNIGQYRRYKYDSVRDLLRLMRNKLNHYRELPAEIQEFVGPIPAGFDGYFATRFPRLLIQVHKVMYRYCSKEECFQKYFTQPTFN